MARTEGYWEKILGYIQTQEELDVLISGVNKYLNFNTVSGSSGYGFRDNGGTMQFKNSGGEWQGFSGLPEYLPLDVPAGAMHPSTTNGATYEVKELGTVNIPCFEMTKASANYVEFSWSTPRFINESTSLYFYIEGFSDNASNNGREAVFEVEYRVLDAGDTISGSWSTLSQTSIRFSQNRVIFSDIESGVLTSLEPGNLILFRIHRNNDVGDNALDSDVYLTRMKIEYEKNTFNTSPMS